MSITFGRNEASSFSFTYGKTALNAYVMGVGGLQASDFSTQNGKTTFSHAGLFDAEKTSANTEDNFLCWAAAASNMLAWTGWGGRGLKISGENAEDSIFTYYSQHFTDIAYYIDGGLDWFFKSNNLGPCFFKKNGGGNLFNMSSTPVSWGDKITNLENDLKNKRGVGISFWVTADFGHAVTVFGYTSDPKKKATDQGYYTGLFITDSDDDKHLDAYGKTAGDVLRYVPLSYNAAKDTYYLLYDNKDYGSEYGMIMDYTTLRQNAGDAVIKATAAASDEFLYSISQNVYGSSVSCFISTSATQTIQSGGVAVAGEIGRGGKQVVNAGGKATGMAISSDGVQTVAGTTSAGFIDYGGRQIISKGGRAANTKISAGDQYISSGGVATGAVVDGWGAQYVYNGGVASGSIVQSGAQYIYSGGRATGCVIKASGSQMVEGGAIASCTIMSGAYQYVSSGGSVTGCVISSGGCQYVYNGGVGCATIMSGGSQYLYNGASASGTVIASGASQHVYSGRTDYNATINAGGSQWVYGGAAYRGAVAGRQIITEGIASGMRIWKAGIQEIQFNGHDSGAIVNGSQIVSMYGESHDAAINFGAHQIVYSGGFAGNTGLSGIQHVYSGATVSNAKIYVKGEQKIYSGADVSGGKATGRQTIYAGGSAIGGVFNKGAFQDVYGEARASLVAGTQNIYSGGYGELNRIAGVQTVSDGGFAASAIISRGGQQQVYGKAINASVAGTQTIYGGGSATGAKVWKTGVQILESGATEVKTIANGSQIVSSGGRSFNAAINKGATQIIYGAARNTGLSGEQYVYAGASVTLAKIYINGVQYLQKGASISGAKATGRQIVSAGATAANGVFNSGARQDVYGVAANIIMAGLQNIYKGGVASGGSLAATGKINVMAGGTLRLAGDMAAAGQINLTGASVTGTAGNRLNLSATSYLTLGAGNSVSNITVNAQAGSLLINGGGNRVNALTTATAASTTFDLRNLGASATPLLALSAKSTLNGAAAIQVKSGQQLGTYALASNLTRNGSMNLAIDGKNVASLTSGSAFAHNGVSYRLVTSSGNLALNLSKTAGNAGVNVGSTSSHAAVFGGTLGEFSRYAAAAAPTANQATAARNDLWKKSGLLA